ncbi:hypothetical protein EfmAA242_32790 (plasmid) [Enterococcus faecium]|nr:hypothetical protein EfmAA242_32790 [Enterococcus faecium]
MLNVRVCVEHKSVSIEGTIEITFFFPSKLLKLLRVKSLDISVKFDIVSPTCSCLSAETVTVFPKNVVII